MNGSPHSLVATVVLNCKLKPRSLVTWKPQALP